MKTFEFTQEACEMIAMCIKSRIDYLNSVNQTYVEYRDKGIWGNDIVNAFNANYEKIGKLKTLMDYINS